MSLAGIIIGLAVLIFLAFKGCSIIWVAPLAATIVALFGMIELLPAYTGTYMTGLADFTKSWFPVFLMGAIFGKMMEVTGAAQSTATLITRIVGANEAILAVVIACAALTYGGISLFVVVFAMYPLAVALFREANISRKLIPGTIALGAFTFTMTALPGSPQIQNLIPMDYYGTTPMAAPIMGLIATGIMFAGGIIYLKFKQRKLAASGELFIEPKEKSTVDTSTLPNPIVSIIPLISVPITLNLLNWSLVQSLLLAIILIGLFNLKKWKDLIDSINSGASGSVMAILNTSAAVGFGSVVKSVPGFTSLTNMLLGIKGSPLISEAVSVSVLAGATGSASGGMGIALAALGEKYMELSQSMGIPPAAFHRIASLASGGLDTLPHNGAVLTLLAVTGMTHKDSYIDIFVLCCVLPIIAVAVCIIFASFGIV